MRSQPSSFFNHLLWFVFCFFLPLSPQPISDDMHNSIKYIFVMAGWFLDRSFCDLIILLHYSCCNCNVVWYSSLFVSAARFFSVDFAASLKRPFSSPFLYPQVLGSFSKADCPSNSVFLNLPPQLRTVCHVKTRSSFISR